MQQCEGADYVLKKDFLPQSPLCRAEAMTNTIWACTKVCPGHINNKATSANNQSLVLFLKLFKYKSNAEISFSCSHLNSLVAFLVEGDDNLKGLLKCYPCLRFHEGDKFDKSLTQ